MGFVLPYEQWMKTELRSFCEERLHEVKAISILNEKQIDLLWTKFLAGNKRVSWSRVWPLVVLGDWMKSNLITD
jgi:asparagine synthase (glutamine-hydrolysing)